MSPESLQRDKSEEGLGPGSVKTESRMLLKARDAQGFWANIKTRASALQSRVLFLTLVKSPWAIGKLLATRI